ncbi:MAG: hypothetical protein AVDCRST_MAG01-01-2219 [uncultured Rubrobacteraceae bacterium]|uniref:Rhodanese domain-containing protein n=1 Tax=uncultured Rubrobacteraceae bacterium TaxID=349277 RepID=A0A6J4PM82_9ACTN|nr:MAG: hypothetical protein AVDCRST_MAG01-01-2219 [uncultured Rubrobacteraceae bacterium]
MADQTHGPDPSGDDPKGGPNEEELREIEGLLGGGESPLSRGPAASSLPEQNLDHDRYDRRLWGEILEASAELSSLRGDEEAPSTFPALLEDLFLSYFKAQPDLLPETGVEPRHRRANRPFVERTLDDPDTYRARATTRLDVPASALSALAAGERLLEEIKNRPSLAEFFDEAAKQPPAFPGPEDDPPDAPQGEPQAAPQAAPQPDEEQEDAEGETPPGPSPELPGRDARRAARAAANAGREEAENLAGALAGWGLTPADLKRVPLGDRLRLLKALSAQEMGRLIDLVGKMRFLARQKAREKVRERRDEVHSVELSGDLARLLPSELALIASPQEERSLAALGRLARGESLSWELRGKEKEKKGPLIALVDCSGSMDDPFGGGSPSASSPASPSAHKKMEWATAVALGLVDLAAGRGGAPKRASAVLFFNARVVHEARFAPGERDARKLLGVATVSAGGGTDYVPAIVRALEIAAESEYRGADLVLVTDELCRVDDRFLEGFLAEKARLKLRLLSVVIGYASTGELGRYSDHVWPLTDLAGPAMGAAGEVFGLI